MNSYKPEGMLIKEISNLEGISTLKGLECALESGKILESEKDVDD